MTSPKPPARPAATPASASSTTTARRGGTSRRRGGVEEVVGRRLAAQPAADDVAAVDDEVEQRADAGGAQHGVAVGARGDDGGVEAGAAQPLDPADRAGEGVDAVAPSACSTSACLRLPIASTAALRERRIPRAARKSRTPAARGLPSTCSWYSLLGVERPLAALGEERIERRFQHAACSSVVATSTPSRSKSTAS